MLILSIALLDIALLLLPLSPIRGSGIDTKVNPVIADPVSAKPYMTGVRLTSWDDQRQLFFLQIESLEPIAKTLGPFQMDDYRDVCAINCHLRSGSASLAGNLQEIGKLLALMMKSQLNPMPGSLSASPPELEPQAVTYTESLVRLPPALIAKPFACAISQPRGGETFFRAGVATFDPAETDIALEGNVEVKGANQTRLTAEQMSWRVIPQELTVEGDYCFQSGGREIKGRGAAFSLAGGGLEPVKSIKTQALPDLRGLPSSVSMVPLMMSTRGKSFHFRKKTILTHLSKTAFQMMSATAAPMNRPATTGENQGKETALSSAKPTFYPASPMTRPLQEIVGRELFSEKIR
jgi:hypothetical protein